jgi:hypothetical protein
VRAWLAQAPPWLEVRPKSDIRPDAAPVRALEWGERAAIALALAVRAVAHVAGELTDEYIDRLIEEARTAAQSLLG